MTIIAKGKKVIQRLISILLGYKKTIVTSVTNYLNPSRLIKQILMTFLGIFGIGTIAFIITVKYLSLETLNSYFSLLSSLTTIFAAFVAAFITQDFRKQKRAELLSEFSKEKIPDIKSLYLNLLDLYKNLQKIIDTQDVIIKLTKSDEIAENKVFLNNFINFKQNYDYIIKLIDKKNQNTFYECEKSLYDYYHFALLLHHHIHVISYSFTDNETADFNNKNETLFTTANTNLETILHILKKNILYL